MYDGNTILKLRFVFNSIESSFILMHVKISLFVINLLRDKIVSRNTILLN